MGRVAFVFPGQGAQAPGMGRDLYEHSPAAKRVLDQAESLFPGLLSLCFGGPMERLTRTDNAQPALLAVEAAALAALRKAGFIPDACNHRIAFAMLSRFRKPNLDVEISVSILSGRGDAKR